MKRHVLLLILVALLLAACGDEGAEAPPVNGGDNASGGLTADTAAPTAQAAAPTAAIPPTATIIPPTPTPSEPVVAVVNGVPIYESAFLREQAFFAQNSPAGDTSPDAAALAALVERQLIAQAAAELGIQVDPTVVDARFEELRSSTEANGGAGAFDAWLQVNGLTAESFRELLRYELLTAAVAERVTADVPTTMEHVRARYIQVDDPALAQQLLAELDAGADFATLAQIHSLDPNTAPNGGDLGFFAPGTLLVPEVEAAAFALGPGEYSDVIAVTDAESGQSVYYLVQTVERDPARPLDFTLRNEMLSATYESWLAERRAGADIQILIDGG
jgi:parvulin-like peptidyl-prolyl isomerase